MSEQELKKKAHNLYPDENEQDREKIVRASHELRRMLLADDVNPEAVLLRGIPPQEDKWAHTFSDPTVLHGKFDFSFGTLEDTMPKEINPSSSEVTEAAGDAWGVNPLKYALQGGRLRVYDREAILAYDHNDATKEGYGTVYAQIPPRELRAAQKAYRDYFVIQDPKVAAMSKAQFEAFDTSNLELMEHQWREVGIEPNSGIVRIDVVDEEGKVAESHYYNTTDGNNYGDQVQRVLEIGREYEPGEDPYIAEELGDKALDEAGINEPGEQDVVSSDPINTAAEIAATEELHSESEQDETEEKLASETETSLNPELQALLEDSSWNNLSEYAGQLQTSLTTTEMGLGQVENGLAVLSHDEGRTETILIEFRNSVDSFLQTVQAGNVSGDMRTAVSRLVSQAEEVRDRLARDASVSENDVQKANQLEAQANELLHASNAIVSGYDHVSELMHPHGRFISNSEDLLRTPRGAEMNIGLLYSDITDMKASLSAIRSALTAAQASLSEVESLR
jgi:hypothetical protein